MDTELDLDFKPTYDWCVKAFSLVKKRLGINICLHDDYDKFAEGDIYLFNHFARFETIIPQYLIHEETGKYCRCVAAGELFENSEAFTSFLYGVGAVPHNHPGLLPFLAAEILRGRKVIIFPEGGMVKDRHVVGPSGEYSIFSPTAKTRRKHHTGAAVLALTVELFKQRVLSVFDANEYARLERWAKALEMETTEELLAVASKPTEIIPANITFYPIRASDNILSRSAEFFSKGSNPRLVEEVLIEANMILKDCDMDIRVSKPLDVRHVWRWWEKRLLSRVFNQINSLDDFFKLSHAPDTLNEKIFKLCSTRGTNRLRDYYMDAIYSGVTVNLYHLASCLIRYLVLKKETRISKVDFHRILYLAIKSCQKKADIHLHRSLTKPENYWNLNNGQTCDILEKYMSAEGCAEHINEDGNDYLFDETVLEETSFNTVRLENLIRVYANEVTPIKEAVISVEDARETVSDIDRKMLALYLLDDEDLSLVCDRKTFTKPQHHDVNVKETASTPADPYLIVPENCRNTGVLVVHGLLASPAELYEFGRDISELGYAVMGVRLKGHGTSPWDLRDKHWEDWMASIARGRQILSAFVDDISLVGFATGGTLSLLEAAHNPEGISSVSAVSVPWQFKTSNLLFAHLAHGLERLTSWAPAIEEKGIFKEHPSENPKINYRSVPVRTTYELYQLHEQLRENLPSVSCPVKLFQGIEDPIVDAKGINEVFDLIGTHDKELIMVEAERHGILHENIGNCRQGILDFLKSIDQQAANYSEVQAKERSEEYLQEKRGAGP
ncbi:serine aminopeptidase domain-containing protein [Kiloniella sp. EL199]|uniref:serine aminopeptidase domain-containing protein n=1 Tax=Kiloniella sp. EL199 TaxID=2107581 RepID=UPI000EA1D490|nr:alpha/beta hydrolase [Kiloniella sp. EL199]